jgi:hypothetical protein
VSYEKKLLQFMSCEKTERRLVENCCEASFFFFKISNFKLETLLNFQNFKCENCQIFKIEKWPNVKFENCQFFEI